MSPCYPFRPIPGQCGPHKRGLSPAPPFNPQDYWATRKLVNSLFGSLDTKKLDKVDVVDPSTATEDGKAADAKSTYKELTRISGMASDVRVLVESKADKATTLAGYGITDAATKVELASKADLVDGKVLAAQLPSFVDDVLEYDTMSAFPAAGEAGKIYIAKDTNLTYRWSGTQYVEISQSLALGETASTAYPGDKGKAATETAKAAYDVIASHIENKDNPHAVTAVQVGAVPFVEDSNGNKTAVTIGSRDSNELVGNVSLVNGYLGTASGEYSHAEGYSTVAAGRYSHSEGSITIATGNYSHAEGEGSYATGNYSHAEGEGAHATGNYSHAQGNSTYANGVYAHAEGATTVANGTGSHAEGSGTTADAPYSHASGVLSSTKGDDKYAFAWNGDGRTTYTSHGQGTFNINPAGGLDGFYIGEENLASIMANKANKAAPSADGNLASLTPDGNLADSGKTVGDFLPRVSNEPVRSTFDIHGPLLLSMNGYIQLETAGFIYGSFDNIREEAGSPSSLRTELDSKANLSMISATNTTFSNAVLAVGLNIDTNSVAVLNEIANTFGDFPLGAGETATTVGGLLAALAAAAAWLKKNKVQTLKLNDNSVETSADGGVAKLDDFFTESNSYTGELPTPTGKIKNTKLDQAVQIVLGETGGDDEKTQIVFSAFAKMDDFTKKSVESDSFDVAITKLSQLLGEDVAA